MDDCENCGGGMPPRRRKLLLLLVGMLLLLTLIPMAYFTLPALTGNPRIQVARTDLTAILIGVSANTPIGGATIPAVQPTTRPLAAPTQTSSPAAATSAPTPTSADEQTREAEAVLQRVNAARQNEGLGVLQLEPRLMAAARLHSNDQAQRGVMSHDGGDGSQPHERVTRAGYVYCQTGENVASRFDVSAAGVFDQWWNSPPHHENMMTAAFVDMGLAYATAADGTVYYTMVLGKPC